MEIRFSPYNSPFVPHDAPAGVYYIGAEFRDMPHSAHVYEWQRDLGRQRVDQLNRDLASAVALLPMLDEMSADGIKAAARRAADIRKSLSPYQSQKITSTGRRIAKRPSSLHLSVVEG